MQPEQWQDDNQGIGLFTMYKQLDEYATMKSYSKIPINISPKNNQSKNNNLLTLKKCYPPPQYSNLNFKYNKPQKKQSKIIIKKQPKSQRININPQVIRKSDNRLKLQLMKSVQIGSQDNTFKRKKIIRFSQEKNLKHQRYRTEMDQRSIKKSISILKQKNNLKTQDYYLGYRRQSYNLFNAKDILNNHNIKHVNYVNDKKLPSLSMKSRWERRSIPKFVIKNPIHKYQTYKKAQQTSNKKSQTNRVMRILERNLPISQIHPIDLRAYYFLQNQITQNF